jgi:hypothetical protein
MITNVPLRDESEKIINLCFENQAQGCRKLGASKEMLKTISHVMKVSISYDVRLLHHASQPTKKTI